MTEVYVKITIGTCMVSLCCCILTIFLILVTLISADEAIVLSSTKAVGQGILNAWLSFSIVPVSFIVIVGLLICMFKWCLCSKPKTVYVSVAPSIEMSPV